MKTKPEYVSFASVNRTLDAAIEIYDQRIKDAIKVYSKYKDEFEIRECPVCGDKAYHEIDEFHDTYGIVSCDQCASVYVNPCPNLNALEYYYNSCACNEMLGKVYRSRVNTSNPIISQRTAYIIEIIKELIDSKKDKSLVKVLEVGCSSGIFLSELKSGLAKEGLLDRCDLQGVDIDQSAIRQSVDTDLNLEALPVEKFAENNTSVFDLVVHFELIEHLSDPFQFMESINTLLKSSGVHHFHTPNALGMDNQALGWNATRLLAHGIFPPMHVNAFTTQNILHFSLRSGFKVVSVDTPGKLDVDIVKLLANELEDDSPYSSIVDFTDDQLAVVQGWLNTLNASSHMRVTLEKG
jgi:2-polyprenyl-6-hydroxyphenyl methylase / 3-demethylubiquinone-9 3-methyltransferase